MDFSNPGSPRRQYARSILSAFGSAWLWVSMVTLVLSTLANRFSGYDGSTLIGQFVSLLPSAKDALGTTSNPSFFTVVVLAPLIEEAVFRMLPLSCALVLANILHEKHERHAHSLVRATLIVVCCLLFGVLHGSVVNILIQGAVGLVLGRLYLRHSNSQWKAYWACVAVHAAYNFAVTATPYFH